MIALQKTLILIKPDGVERGLIGECLKRFEQRGFKVIGMKMVWSDKDHALKHYTEDISQRRGQEVRDRLVEFITNGPVVAIAIEGVNAIENIRKLVGPTEPKSALPGTIRGDFAHASFAHADDIKIPIKNIIHASADKKDADSELALWFSQEELHTYNLVHDKHIKE
jgi:nucleoside-diphosphate kinase